MKNIGELERLLGCFPDAYVELSYAMDEDLLNDVMPLVGGRIASIHSLCPRREFFPNFASSDEAVISWSEKELMKDAAFALSIGAEILVLHPGYLLPSLIPSDKNRRIEALSSPSLEQYIGIRDGSICCNDYIFTPEYRRTFSLMSRNLRGMNRKLSDMGIRLALENLNPRAGYMLIHPDEMVALSRSEDFYFTLDIGHLYVSAELFGFDFLSGLKKVLDTGRVVTTHLHSNPSSRRKGLFTDSHQSLDGFSMPYEASLSLIERSGANMMLEVVDSIEHNLCFLFP